MKINDFGGKIGGAKKDLWAERGLNVEDLLSMNEREIQTLVTKKNVWKKPNYQELKEQGRTVRMVYFIKQVYDGLPTKCNILSGYTAEKKQQQYETYVSFIHEIKENLLAMKTEEDVLNFYTEHVLGKYVSLSGGRYLTVNDGYHGIIENRFVHAVQEYGWYGIDSKIVENKFLYTEEQKLLADYKIYQYDGDKVKFETDYSGKHLTVKVANGKLFYYPSGELADEKNWIQKTYFVVNDERIIVENNIKNYEEAKSLALKDAKLKNTLKNEQTKKKRKGKLKPVQLEHVTRNGDNYRHNRNVTGNDYDQVFGISKGEFGNWLNNKDRQYSMNYGYDAFLDLSRALHIHPKDISLDGMLKIAFGSRGNGFAVAHYEPLRKVINLTKMKGAGSLAHEWGHAFDDYIGMKLGFDDYATNHFYELKSKLPSFYNLIDTMKYKDYKQTKFYSDANAIDGSYSRCDKGYWGSTVEMFARAFACYVHDKLNFQSDYLTGHANTVTARLEDDTLVYGYPIGEERTAINRCFDEVIKELKNLEILHDYEYEVVRLEPVKTTENQQDIELHYDADGQFCLFDMEEEREVL